MAQMKGALPEPRLQDSTVPFRPYSCDIDGDSNKVGVRVRARVRAKFRCLDFEPCLTHVYSALPCGVSIPSFHEFTHPAKLYWHVLSTVLFFLCVLVLSCLVWFCVVLSCFYLVSSRLVSFDFLSKVELEDFLRAVVLGRTNWDMVTTGRASQLVGSVEFPAGELRSVLPKARLQPFLSFLTTDLRICLASRLV
jgi:hypothetical protein